MRVIYSALALIGTLLLLQTEVDGQVCRQSPVDVFFIAESSLDVGRFGFNLLKNFFVDVAENIGISPTTNRISITLFNKEVLDVQNLTESDRVKELSELMEDTKFWGGHRTTNIGRAMEYVADVKFDEEYGRRPEAAAVCVIVVEGVSSDVSDVAAQNLREKCRVIVLGIDRPNYYELSRIASEPTMGHLKTMQSYIDLVRFHRWVATTICKPPISVLQLQRGRVTHDSIQIAWTLQPFASRYIINLRLSGKTKVLQTLRAPQDVTNVTFTGLREGTSYSFDAWPVDVDGVRGPKAVIFISSGILVPNVTLDPLSVTKTSAVVFWPRAKLGGVTYYITIREADTQQFVTSTSVAGSRYTITNLRPGTSYSVELAAVYRGARSESDERLIFHTVPDPPLPTVAYVTDRAVRLNWDQIRGASLYGIRTYDTETSTGIELLVRVDETNATTFEVQPLLSGKRYRFTVTSKTDVGTESEESLPIFQRIAPSNPRKIKLISRTTKSINITWDAQEGVTQYMVQFKASLSPDLVTRNVNTTFFYSDGLATGAMYIFKVFSIGEDSTSDTENPAEAKFQTVPGKVEGLLVQGITQNSVTLQWSKTRGAVEYLLRFKNAQTKKVLRTVQVKGDEVEVDGLQTGITYLITVAAVGVGGEVIGKESDPQMVITLPAVPDRPWLTDKTNSTLTFKWDAVQGAIQYLLFIQKDGDTGPRQYRTRSTSYTFDGLSSGSWYEVRLRSVGSGGRINTQSSESARGQTVPKTPDKPQIIDLTATTVTIKWDRIKGAVGYILNIRMVGKKRMLETRNTTETEYRIANLKGGESYHAIVIAYSYDGHYTEESAPTLMKTMPEAPDKPRVLGVSSSTVTLEWDEVKGASGYIISISDKRKLSEVKSETNRFTITDLKPSTQYSFGLYSLAIEGTRNEKESERVEAITAPSPPSEVRIINAGTTYVELAWNPVRGAVSYIVRYRSIRDDEGLESGELEANNPSFQTVSDLTAGFIYEFSVYAVGQDGSRSDPGILIDGTLPATPDAPLVLLIGSTNATLSWNPAKGALSYIIMARAKGFEREFTSDTTRVDIDGLEAGTKYEFSVMSVGINKRVNRYESEKKKEQTLTSPPTNFQKGKVSSTEIYLSWDQMKGAIYYSVAVELADGTPVRKYMAFKTTYTLKRLTPGTAYSISIASVGTNFIESDFTKALLVSTVPASPKTPQLVRITSTTAELMWNPVQGAVEYILGVKEDGNDEIKKFNVFEAKITVENLSSGTWYEFFVYSVGSDGQMSEDRSRGIRVQTVPLIPPNFSVGNVATTSITIRWDKVKGAKMYDVKVMKGDDSIANMTTRDNELTVWHLQPGTLYNIFLEAEGEEGRDSGWSQPLSESTATEVPMQPFLVEIFSTTATLEWNNVQGAIRYVVFYVNREINERKSEEVTEAMITLENLEPGTWYDFSVMSLGEGEKASDESDILDEQTVPLTPANVQIKNVGMNFINIVWDASKGASSYIATCSYRDANNEAKKIKIETENSVARFKNLLPGTMYEISVQAVGQTGSKSVASLLIEENTIPDTPENLELLTIENEMFQVKWKPVKGAASYVVEITPEVGKKYYRETEKSVWTEKDLQPGKWFKVDVQSKDRKNRGNGVATKQMEIQTICLQPNNVRMSEAGTTFVKFDWNKMEGVDFYLVTVLWSIKDEIINTFGGQEVEDGETIPWEGSRGKKKDGLLGSSLEQFKIDPSQVVVKEQRAWYRIQTRTNKIEIAGLDPATYYNFQFQSVNEQGRVSMQKAYVNETTLPNKVTFVSLLGITESSAMLGWDEVEGVQHYVVNVTRQLNGAVTTFESEESTITLTELVSGSWYNVEIFTVGMNGNMNYEGSEELSFQTIPSRPENVEITDIGTTSMNLKWDEDEGVTYYKVIIRLTRPFNVLFRVDESRSSQHLVEKLTPGTKYIFTVVSVTTGGRESRPSKLLVETTVPAKPTNLRLMDIATTTASLQWDNVEGAFQFLVSVSGDDGTKTEKRTKGTVITIEDLLPGTWYDFWVRSVGINGRRNEEESNIIRQQTTPSSPGNLVVEEITTTTISLSWRKVHGVKQYQVFVEMGDGSQQIYNATRSYYALSQLDPGASYTIYVTAVGTGGQNSQKSETVILSTVPESVVDLNIVSISSTHIELQWTPVTGATGYTITVRNPVTGRVIRRIDTQQSSHIVTQLEPGSTYIFSITVKGKTDKNSGESPQLRVQTTPLPPTGFKSGKVTTTSVELRWKPVPGVKLYKVIISEEEFPDTIWRTDEVQKTEHTVAGLRPGITYIFGVVTVGTSGRESDSSEIITETTYPERPTGLLFNKVNTTTMIMEWDPVDGARHYTVHVKGDDRSKKEIIVLEELVSIPALSPGGWYEIYVVAVGEKNRESLKSETLREQTEPLAPTKLLVKNVGTTSISIQWEPVIGVKFYEVTIHSMGHVTKNTTQTFVADETDYTINELVPGVEHVITVVGVGTSGRKSEPSEPLKQSTVPAALDEVIIKSATTTSITLQWFAITGASSYTIVIRSASDRSGAVLRTIDTTETTYKVPALVPGDTYLFSIRSKGYGGKLSKESPRVRAHTVPLPPSRVQITDVGTTSVSLAWKEPNGAEFYRVFTRNSDGDVIKTDDVKTTKHTVDGLNPGTKYVFTISAIGRSGRESDESSPVSQVTKPSGPSGVIISDVETTSITVTWKAVKGARSYKVMVEDLDRNTKKKQEEYRIQEYEAFTNRYTVTKLQAGTRYAITISSLGVDGQESAPSLRLVEQTVPASPSNVILIDVKETSMTLKWDRVHGVSYYVVAMKDPITGTETRMETKANQIKVDDLSPGTEYEFSVFSVGSKERMNAESSKPLVEQTVSAPVEGLRVAVVTATTVTLRWNRSPGVARYTVRVRDHSTGALLDIYESVTVQFKVENLQPGRNYSFTVTSVARNGKESEESEEVVASTGISIPPEPTVQQVTESSVTLIWDEVDGAREYLLVMHDVEKGEKTRIAVEEEFIVVADLLPGHSYSFSLIAIGDSGETSQEGPATMVDTIPSAPVFDDVDSVSTSSIKLSWKKIKGALKYTIIARWQPPGERRRRVLNATTIRTTHELDLPLPGINYEITIRAEGSSGFSANSGVLRENTLPRSPSTPTAGDITSTSMGLTWESVTGAASYEILVVDETAGKEDSLIVYRSSAQLTNLRPGTWHKITLFSRDVKQRKNKRGSQILRVQTVPTAPVNVRVSSVTTSSASLTWRRVPGAVMYEVEVIGSEVDIAAYDSDWKNVNIVDGQVTFFVETAENNVRVGGLKPGSNFQFFIRSVGDQDRKSDPFRTEATTLPGTVEEILVKKVSTDSATLEWQDVKGVAFYRVRARGQKGVETLVYTVQQPSVTLENLAAGTWYNVSIVTYDVQNRTSGSRSYEQGFQTVPRQIVDTRTSQVTTNSMLISWGSVKGATTYEVKLLWSGDGVSLGHLKPEGRPGRDGLSYRTFQTPLTEVNLSQLDPGTMYWYEVSSLSEEGRKSEPSIRRNETTLPSGISEISVNTVTETTISLSWDAIKGAQKYAISITAIHQNGPPMRRETRRPQILVQRLEPGTLYEFVVTPVGGKGRKDRIESSNIRVKTTPRAPEKVTVQKITETSISVSWGASTGAVRYKIIAEYKDENRQLQSITFLTTETEFEMTELQPGLRYAIYVIAFGNRLDDSASDRSDVLIQRTMLPRPENFKVDDYGEDFVTLSWEASDGATSYMIYITDLSTGTVTPIDVGDEALSTDVTNLQPGARYQFTIKAVNREDNMMSKHSETVEQRTRPSAPQSVQATDVGSNTITVEWSPVLGAASYTIFITEKGSTERSIADHEDTTILLDKLTPGTEYKIQIIAVTEEGIESKRSNRITQVTAPNAPGTPTIKSFTTTTVELEWGQMKGATSYVVTVTDTETGEKIEVDAGSSLSVELTDLQSGTVYAFTVRGENVEKGLKSDESGSVTQSTYPKTPRVQVVSFTPDRISISWQRVKGASTYSVFYRLADGDQPMKEVKRITKPEYTIEGLESGSDYEIQVQAIMENGLRSDRSLRITQSTSPNVPTGLEIYNVTQNSFSINWVAAKGASSYQLIIENTETGERLRVESYGDLLHTFFNLKPGTLYTVYAYALTLPLNTRSDRSEIVQQRTLPVMPRNLVAFDIEENSVSLEWRKVRGADSYTVYVNKVGESEFLERQIKNLKDTEAVIDRLSPGTLYQFQVAAVTENGLAGKRSGPVEQQTVPAPPQDIVISNVTSTSFIVDWSKSEGATSYTLRLVNEETKDDRRKTVGDTNSTKFGRLDSGTMYKITIVAQRKESDVTSRNSYRVFQRTLPAAPENVKVDSATTESVALEWDSSKGAATYTIIIYQLDVDGFAVDDGLYIDLIENTYIEIIELYSGTDYLFEVYAVTSENLISDNAGIVYQGTRYLPPVLPQSPDPLVRLTEVTSSRMVADWDPIQYADSYILVIRSDRERDRYITDIRNTTAEIIDLRANTEYSVTLIAVGRSGDETEESSPPAVQTTMPLPPSTPTGLQAAEFTDSSVLVTWNPVPRAVSYEIEITDTDTNEKRNIRNIQQPRYDVKNLEPEKRYIIRVIAVGRFEKSLMSEEIETGAKYPIPVMLFNESPRIQASNIQWNSMTLMFPLIQDAVSYTILIRLNGEIFREMSGLKSRRHEISDLSEVTEYQITYYAVGRGGDTSEESDPSLFVTTLPHTPDPPNGVGASDESADTVVVYWDDTPRALAYDVIITEQGSTVPQFYENVTSPYIAAGLVFDTRYIVTVVSVGRYDRSAPSKEVKFKTRIPKPGNIRLIFTQSVTETEVMLLWSPATYAVSYTITVRLDGEEVQKMEEILGNSIRIEGLKQGTTYDIGVKAIGLEKDEGNEHTETVTTLEGSIGQEEKEEINEFGIDESTLDEDTDSNDTGTMEFVVPETLEEALSTLVANMVEIPDDEVREDATGKKVIKKTSLFRTTMWRLIETVQRFLISELGGGLGERKSDTASVRLQEYEGAEEAVDKLVLLSKELKNDPKEFGETGGKKVAFEIASLLTEIIIQSPEFEDFEGSGQENVQEFMAPILEELVLEVVLGGMEVKVHQVNAKGIILTWTGKLPRETVEFKIREAGKEEFLESIVVDESMTTVRFGRLEPGTEYEIFVMRGETKTIFSEVVTTKELFSTKPPAPRNLRVAFTARTYVSVRWSPVKRGDSTIVYVVRLYKPRAENPIERFKMQKATTKSITKLKSKTSYEVTVSSYDVKARKQSDESPRLRIRTK